MADIPSQQEVYKKYQDGRSWVERHPTLTVLYAIGVIIGSHVLRSLLGL